MSAGVLFDAPGPKTRARYRLYGVIAGIVLAAVLAFVVWKLYDGDQLTGAKWKPIVQGELWDAYLIPGIIGTVKAAAISIVFASIFGGVFALLRMSSIKAISWTAGVIVEFFRAVPVLLMMIFSWGMYVQYNVFSSEYSTLAGVVTALTLYNGSVMCEVIRSGVDQLPKGQGEAGLSVGLTRQQTLRSILLPQAITAMLPALVSQLVVILKDTALGFNITYGELLYSANSAASNYGNLIPLMLVVAALYILINYGITKFAEWIERRLARRGRATVDPASTAGGGLAGPTPGAADTGRAV